MSNFCSNCGTPLEGAAKFCPSCGTAVVASGPPAAAPTQAAAPTAPPQGLHNQQYQASPAQQPPSMQQPGQPFYNNASNFSQPPYPGQNINPTPGFSSYSNEPYIPDQTINEKFFRYDNRLNRKRYILRGLALVGIYIVAALIVGTIGMMIDELFGTLLIWLLGLAVMVPSIMLLIRRLHDLNRPGWWAVGNFIPVLNIALSIYVLFIPGTPGPNQYGPDPLSITN
ncbi:DUF805 domain-containing protein [Selenomonas sp.]|uniref:DUF805 domain-containing protein n=1 Tax=Selenomonas sp. TaxID=2053611 RepID=UPI0025F0B0CE|nr:DUF805 domain-containing protein [Selenomonas sp.]MBQ1867054.1 DUF805 domain-containing protein [Selenomonas sp.]